MDDLELKLYATLGKASVDFPKREVVIPFKVSLSSVDLNALAEFADITVELRLRSQTLPLGSDKPKPGADQSDDLPPVTEEQWAKVTGSQTATTGGEVATFTVNGQESATKHYSLMLNAMPDKSTSAGELKYKKVERVLGKLWGEKVPEVRARIDTAPGKPVNVIDKANLTFVLETKAKLEEHGAACEVVEWPEPTVGTVTEALADAVNSTTEGPLADVTAEVPSGEPAAETPEDPSPLLCMEPTESGAPCPNVAKWRTHPEKAINGADGIWCDDHKQDDDVPLEEARLVAKEPAGDSSGLLAASGLDVLDGEQPALFEGAPPPPTLADLDARDRAWEGEPGNHRADEALVG